jgi:hypothetical protein
MGPGARRDDSWADQRRNLQRAFCAAKGVRDGLIQIKAGARRDAEDQAAGACPAPFVKVNGDES